MGLILLEALGALLALVFIVWWTMFSGRPKGEPPQRSRPVERLPTSAVTGGKPTGPDTAGADPLSPRPPAVSDSPSPHPHPPPSRSSGDS